MRNTGLQLFAEAVAGKKIMYLYRLAKNASKEADKPCIYDRKRKNQE